MGNKGAGLYVLSVGRFLFTCVEGWEETYVCGHARVLLYSVFVSYLNLRLDRENVFDGARRERGIHAEIDHCKNGKGLQERMAYVDCVP